jgi:2-polyprenyl-3-methyl-5-hydroxy-6-metoxy-1,4-benzoquinol methylase
LALPDLSTHCYSEPDEYYAAKGEQSRTLETYARLTSTVRRFGITRGRVLDVGCSAGHLLAEFSRNGWHTLGIESSPAAAAFAVRHFNLNVMNQPLDSVKLTQAVDLITLIHVLEHLPDPVSALRRLSQSLLGSGLIVMEFPNFDSWLLPVFGGNYRPLCPWDHLWFFTPTTAARLVQRAGLRIRELRTMETLADVAYTSILSALDSIRFKAAKSPEHWPRPIPATRARGTWRNRTKALLDRALIALDPLYQVLRAIAFRPLTFSNIQLVADLPRTQK